MTGGVAITVEMTVMVGIWVYDYSQGDTNWDQHLGGAASAIIAGDKHISRGIEQNIGCSPGIRNCVQIPSV
jgi:hypothetical protein